MFKGARERARRTYEVSVPGELISLWLISPAFVSRSRAIDMTAIMT